MYSDTCARVRIFLRLGGNRKSDCAWPEKGLPHEARGRERERDIYIYIYIYITYRYIYIYVYVAAAINHVCRVDLIWLFTLGARNYKRSSGPA